MFEVSAGTIKNIVSIENKIPEFNNGFEASALRNRL